jgi:hypothetical protein
MRYINICLLFIIITSNTLLIHSQHSNHSTLCAATPSLLSTASRGHTRTSRKSRATRRPTDEFIAKTGHRFWNEGDSA